MPYFRKANLLLIHIPKTGGTSIETYFSNKLNIPLNEESLYGFLDPVVSLKSGVHLNHSLQHLTMDEIKQYNYFFKIPKSYVITIVRNPYERLMSELFYQNKVKVEDKPSTVYQLIRWAIIKNKDNHTLPQHKYIHGRVIILHTETLEEEMHQLGFTDFSKKENVNPNKVNYYDYLNADSIRLINSYYKLDFEWFGYPLLPQIPGNSFLTYSGLDKIGIFHVS
jgi:hypothetical protein